MNLVRLYLSKVYWTIRLEESSKLLIYLPEDFNFFEIYVKAKFIFKWGCDESSGQTEYYQAFNQNTNFIQNDP